MSNIDNKTIKQIVANLAKEGMTLSESEVMDALKDSNLNMNKALNNIAKKVDAERSDELGNDAKKDNIKKEQTKNESMHKDIYQKPVFKNKHTKKSRIAGYERVSQLPRFTSDNRVDMHIQKYNQLKALSLELADLERGQPLQQDEQFMVILDEKEGNFLKEIQNSIGAANEFKRKYNVVKAATKDGRPSIDLTSKLV